MEVTEVDSEAKSTTEESYDLVKIHTTEVEMEVSLSFVKACLY